MGGRQFIRISQCCPSLPALFFQWLSSSLSMKFFLFSYRITIRELRYWIAIPTFNVIAIPMISRTGYQFPPSCYFNIIIILIKRIKIFPKSYRCWKHHYLTASSNRINCPQKDKQRRGKFMVMSVLTMIYSRYCFVFSNGKEGRRFHGIKKRIPHKNFYTT